MAVIRATACERGRLLTTTAAGADRKTVLEIFDSGRSPIVYRIDDKDQVVFVNEAWRSFALANGAADVAERTVGSSLWSSVAGAEMTLLWHELIARARSDVSVSIPYRCDAPDRRRYLRMKLEALPHGGVEFTSTLARSENRDPLALLESAYRAGEPLRSCSWCRRFDADGFVEVEEAVVRLGLLEQELRPITHVLCPACAREVRQVAGLR